MTAIAFLGLGNMGLPMALNLHGAGHRVAGYDVSPHAIMRWLEAGGNMAADTGAAVREADVVITMLPAGPQVHEAYLDEGGILAHVGSRTPLLIDCSTIDVQTARDVAAAAAERGLDMLDAPVSGGVGGAVAGTLTFMVGGSVEGFELARPILEKMGRNVVHAGESGAGQTAKICNNMILGVSMLVVSEAFVLAERLGLDPWKLFDIVSNASGQCWSLTNYCPVPGPVPASPANREYEPGFAAALMLKDLLLSQQAAEAGGAATPLGAHAARLYQALVEQGEGGRDFSYVYRWLSGLSRTDVV
jgi:3-hydroxyisobutyrate dehydrogenase